MNLRSFFRPAFVVAVVSALLVPSASVRAESGAAALLCLRGSLSPIFDAWTRDPQTRYERLFDLTPGEKPKPLNLPTVPYAPAENSRVEFIRSMPIGQVTAAPGHVFLRKPAQVQGLVKYIRESKGGDFSHDPLLFNLIVDEKGKIQHVDLWNAHHRLVAYLEAGYKTLGDIPAANFKVLINGHPPEGGEWPHYLPSAGLENLHWKTASVVPPGGEIRVGTVSVSGKLSNRELGSRTSIRQLHANTFQRRRPKIGVYFGTFDPIHEGHIAVIRAAKAELGLDEVVVLPNPNPIHKPSATPFWVRMEMVVARLRNEPGVNVYLADLADLANKFGRDPVIERIGQVFGTDQIYQIVGSDNARKLIAEDAIPVSSNRKYFVVQRSDVGEDPVAVPEGLRDLIVLSNADDETGVSSTSIRARIARCEKPGAELHPDIYKIIRARGLYGFCL